MTNDAVPTARWAPTSWGPNDEWTGGVGRKSLTVGRGPKYAGLNYKAFTLLGSSTPRNGPTPPLSSADWQVHAGGACPAAGGY